LSILKQAEDYNNAICAAQGLNIQWEEGSPKKGIIPPTFIKKKKYLVTGGRGIYRFNAG
jgi:hypothetical protein